MTTTAAIDATISGLESDKTALEESVTELAHVARHLLTAIDELAPGRVPGIFRTAISNKIDYYASRVPAQPSGDLDDAQTATIGQLIRIAADMIAAIPNDELGDEPAVSIGNSLSSLIRQAAGIPADRGYEIDDAIAWANS